MTASATGIRTRALAHFTPADFRLTDDLPAIQIPATFSKSKKSKTQPVPVEVAVQLRDYLDTLPERRPVWGRTAERGHQWAAMLRRDLDASGIAYSVDTLDGPAFADFHALRHTYLTLLGRSGIDLGTAQILAGHSTPVLTARYTHKHLADLSEAVE